MKSRVFAHICIAGALLAPVSVVQAQALKDPKVVGSYVGILTAHSFTTAGLGLNVAGVLFRFNMQYQSMGYHEGTVSQGVMFMNGRKFIVSGSAVVPPFPGPKNRNVSVYLECRTISALNESLIRWRVAILNASFGKVASSWFGDRADYSSVVVADDLQVQYYRTVVTPTGTVVIIVEDPAEADASFQALRTSTFAGNSRRKVKIQR